jgi:hypothetical protein
MFVSQKNKNRNHFVAEPFEKVKHLVSNNYKLSRKLKAKRCKTFDIKKIKMKVTIDGQAIEVEPGTTILQAARMIGGESVPPAMCYYSKLEGSGGKCRCCLESR